jgi:hypothetical protein
MSFLASLTGVNEVVRNATGLLQELKRPRLSKQEFSTILREELRQTATPDNGEARILQQINALSQRFIETRDADANGRLSLLESGLKPELFAQLDTDGDGELSLTEIRRPYIEAWQTQRNAMQG